MCGRFSLTASADIIADVFGIEGLIDIVPRYNIAPSTPLLCIGMRDGKRVSRLLKWGLIPFWAEDPKIAYKLINARSETAASKPSFRAAFTARRVLIVADGFYEWQREGKTRLPFHIRRPNREVFAMAGLWERWFDDDTNEIRTCTILTTEANDTLSFLHHRMPVILPSQRWDDWLNPKNRDVSTLKTWMVPWEGEPLVTVKVSTAVNNVRNQGPECQAPRD